MNRTILGFMILLCLCHPSGDLPAQEIEPGIGYVMPDSSELRAFAESYTAAWGSRDASSVAAFFAPDGSLTVNDGEPAVGRTAITEVAQGFMTAFPDMRVIMDGLLVRGARVVYQWTFVGTNTGPGGTGHRVDFSGFEVWRFDADGLIGRSRGYFDADEYEHQIAHGARDAD